MNQSPTAALVVDDDDSVRELLSELVSTHPDLDLVFTASSAITARQILRDEAERIGVLLLDHYMPGKTGLELARELARTPGPPLAVLLVTGSLHPEMEDDFRACFSSRLIPVAVIHKPVGLVYLLEQISAALGAWQELSAGRAPLTFLGMAAGE